jgi:hypothetical protein
MPVDVDRELLAECELDYGLLLPASEQRDATSKDGHEESDQRAQHEPILTAYRGDPGD